jgi:hypothetical protein
MKSKSPVGLHGGVAEANPLKQGLKQSGTPFGVPDTFPATVLLEEEVQNKFLSENAFFLRKGLSQRLIH